MKSNLILSFLIGAALASLIWGTIFMFKEDKNEDVKEQVQQNEDDTTVTQDFISKKWVLESIDDQVISDSGAYIEFEATGTVAGYSGCNDFYSTYVLDGTNVTFEPFISTLKLCEDVVDVETEMMNILNSANMVEQRADDLLAISGAEGALMFKLQEEVVNTTTLVGKMWSLATINGEDKRSVNAYIQFEADGTVSGNSACNSFSSTYEIAGTQITFGEFASTLMFCEDTADVETAMMNILNSATQIVEDTASQSLIITGTEGELVFQLTIGM